MKDTANRNHHACSIKKSAISGFTLFALSFGNCSLPVDGKTGTGGQSLVPISSCEEMDQLAFEIERNMNARPGYYFSFEDVSTTRVASLEGGEGGGDVPVFSQTNVQVEGVDEPDLIKTDGKYIYVLNGEYPFGSWVSIYRGYPVEGFGYVTSIATEYLPKGILRWNHYVVILSSLDFSWGYCTFQPCPLRLMDDSPLPFPPDFLQVTKITVVDLSVPEAPHIIYEAYIDGNYNTARLIEDTLYLVGGSSIGRMEYEHNNNNIIIDDGPVDIVPLKNPLIPSLDPERSFAVKIVPHTPLILVKKNKGGQEEYRGRLIECLDCYRPPYPASLMVTYILTLNLDNLPVKPQVVGVAGIPAVVYASRDHIYVSGMLQALQWSDGQTQPGTVIHQFALGDSEKVRYSATGAVKGYLLNQFSMDERDGYLRVATTTGPRWSVWEEEGGSESHIHVLQQEGKTLRVVSAISGIGKGEQIFAVRFIGDKGYVVTFRWADPLFIIDLSDPLKPVMRGELEVPGFSTYIHPLADGYLLAIGWDGGSGLQLSLFDVSDPDTPLRRFSEPVGGYGSYSPAMVDHHAFNYFPSKSLLSLPVVADYGFENDRWVSSSRFYGYSVSPTNGFVKIGEIVLKNIALKNFSSDTTQPCYPDILPLRTVYIDRYFYTMSQWVIYDRVSYSYDRVSYRTQRSSILTVSAEDSFGSIIAVTSDATRTISLPLCRY